MSQALSLDQLTAAIKERLGEDFFVTQTEHGDGSSEAELTINGVRRATWKGRLVTTPPRDGVTPRGPKEYYDLEFYSEPASQPPGPAHGASEAATPHHPEPGSFKEMESIVAAAVVSALSNLQFEYEARGELLKQAEALHASAVAELERRSGYYYEIVKEIGHGGIITEYRQRGELLRQEAQRRKEAEANLATAIRERDEAREGLRRENQEACAMVMECRRLRAQITAFEATLAEATQTSTRLQTELGKEHHALAAKQQECVEHGLAALARSKQAKERIDQAESEIASLRNALTAEQQVHEKKMASALKTENELCDINAKLVERINAATQRAELAEQARAEEVKLSEALTTYIEFLRKESEGTAGLLYSHGWRCSDEVFKEGERLRAEIDKHRAARAGAGVGGGEVGKK